MLWLRKTFANIGKCCINGFSGQMSKFFMLDLVHKVELPPLAGFVIYCFHAYNNYFFSLCKFSFVKIKLEFCGDGHLFMLEKF